MITMEKSPSPFLAAKRKPVTLSAEALVRTSYLHPDQKLPLVIEPGLDHVNLLTWAEGHRDVIREHLNRHGGLLFRGFRTGGPEEFQRFMGAGVGEPLEYGERSSPRSQVSGKIYTSTDHPPDQSIFLHNEQSYNVVFPLRICFFCVTPAREGGETPIADCRQVYRRLSPAVRDRFLEQGYLYVRNFGEGFGLSWREAFQTSDPAAVEDYCRRHAIDFEWKDGGRLRTRQKRRAAAVHPETGEMVWFNHLTFFHVSTLPSHVRDALLAELGEQDLPNNTYYGDGSPIEPEVLQELRSIYQQETVSFPWQAGDILLLDNMMVAHGRSPFVGPRKVVVAMAEPRAWDDV
jgi:alpha-ketoglutarate-dependent taurine dioxygenase